MVIYSKNLSNTAMRTKSLWPGATGNRYLELQIRKRTDIQKVNKTFGISLMQIFWFCTTECEHLKKTQHLGYVNKIKTIIVVEFIE